MSILAAYMVPHPPMIVPEVGCGSEKQVEATCKAYEKVAEEIAEIAPETIIISSPHSVMYLDYFHISPGEGAKGSFAQFRAPQVSFDEKYDTELVDEISRLAGQSGIPAGTLGEREKDLDHGTMVPLYFIKQKYTDFKLVRLGLSGMPLTEHYALGQAIEKAVDTLGRKAVYVGSGDLSHKLQKHGPYGFAPEGPVYDEKIMDVCSRGAFGELFDFGETLCEKAAECGHRSFVIMAGTMDGREVEAKQLSHEDVTGVGYGICTFHPGEKDESRHFLDEHLKKEEEKVAAQKENSDGYVKLARASLESYILDGRRLKMPEDLPAEMTEKRAGAFVSIHKDGALRGCIGTILPTQDSVAEEIIENAIRASTKDPRFDPIRPDELKFLEINVDVLGEPESIDSKEKLDVKRYGVIVTSAGRRGLLLPDLDGVDTVDQQISIAKRKAGIGEDEPVNLQRFEVIRHK
ncbi:MAG: AmmeMemoRadiSam system protein A [Firmicutes bacterium]|nr:AmmeMemoRadiSam system protein A [Bacillota bacterium]